ncbi:MAG: flagellar hook-length control protein FliK, partial [Gemmatimonadota bacterium]|nr:flagellar hook-length control protein FliK [Gemmatimonadota bacterium]
RGLEQAAAEDDPSAAWRVLQLLDRLAGLDSLPASEQLAAVDSLITELKGLNLRSPASQAEVEATPDSGQKAPGSIASAGSTLLDLPVSGSGTRGVESASQRQDSARSSGQVAQVPGAVQGSGTPQGVEVSRPAEIASGVETLPDKLRNVIRGLDELKASISSRLGGNEEGRPAEAPSPVGTKAGGSAASSAAALRSIADSAARLANTICPVESASGGQEHILHPVAESQSENTYQRQNSILNNIIPDSRAAQQAAGNNISMNAQAVISTVPGAAATGTVSQQLAGVEQNQDAVNNITGEETKEIKTGTSAQAAPAAGQVNELSGEAAGPEKAASQSNASHRVPASRSFGSADGDKNTEMPSLQRSQPAGMGQQSSGEEGKAARVSIPVRVESQQQVSHSASSSSRKSGLRQASAVYASQSGISKPDLPAEQFRSAVRSGSETGSAGSNIMNSVVESLQGKGGGMEDQAGTNSQAQHFLQLKVESLHQGLRSETFTSQLLEAGGEQSPRPAGASMFTNQAEMIGKITQAARMGGNGSTSEISIRLEPDHLGQMKVRLSVNENQAVHARITVESHEARSLIEGSLARLRESMAEQGLKVEKFSVDVRQDQHNHQSQGQQSAAGRDNPFRNSRSGMLFNNERNAGGSESTPVQKTGEISRRHLGYNTLEWVA